MHSLKNIHSVSEFNLIIQEAYLIKRYPFQGRKFSIGNEKVSMNQLIVKLKKLISQTSSSRDDISNAIFNLIKLDSEMYFSSNILFKTRRIAGKHFFDRHKAINDIAEGADLSPSAQAALVIFNEMKSYEEETGYALKKDLLKFDCACDSSIKSFLLEEDDKINFYAEELKTRRMTVYRLAEKLYKLGVDHEDRNIFNDLIANAIAMVKSAGSIFGDGDASSYNSPQNLKDFEKLDPQFQEAVKNWKPF